MEIRLEWGKKSNKTIGLRKQGFSQISMETKKKKRARDNFLRLPCWQVGLYG